MYSKILIATDGSDLTSKAVEHDLRLPESVGVMVPDVKEGEHETNFFDNKYPRPPHSSCDRRVAANNAGRSSAVRRYKTRSSPTYGPVR